MGVNEFTPERKMMSIVFLREDEGWLIAKGSDEAIMDVANLKNYEHNEALVNHLTSFGI